MSHIKFGAQARFDTGLPIYNYRYANLQYPRIGSQGRRCSVSSPAFIAVSAGALLLSYPGIKSRAYYAILRYKSRGSRRVLIIRVQDHNILGFIVLLQAPGGWKYLAPNS